ncbi:DDE-type integrase/transposase/recombinase [Cupriavidus sp. BIS7]|uniref:DDE-type integrase/transposase/recombinase n=1 Tax=Cupriavidus sp. BIS7 TaxID=1217718 RepID=UPI00030AB922|nr:DDE-type integrase/transposase/recombinase [Cupriavidus sp. BIS7]
MRTPAALRDEIEELMHKVAMPAAGRDFVRKALSGNPSRKVSSRHSNVITAYTCRSTGQRIATESRGPEYRAAIRYDLLSSVLYFTAQPGSVLLPMQVRRKKKASDGSTNATAIETRTRCTPDFLVIDDGFYVDEWKTEGQLIHDLKKYPYRFSRDENGWHCPEREKFFSEMGLVYRLRSDSEHNPTFVENLEHLSDYLEDNVEPSSEVACRAIDNAMQSVKLGAISFRELMKLAMPLTLPEAADAAQLILPAFTVDDVLQAIAKGQLFADLDVDDLSDLDHTAICRSEATLALHRLSRQATHETSEFLDYSLAIGAEFLFGESKYTVNALTADVLLYRDDSHHVTSIAVSEFERLVETKQIRMLRDSGEEDSYDPVRAPSDEEIEVASHRHSMVEARRYGAVESNVSTRTLQRWAKRAREAGESAYARTIALLDKFRPGNTTCRVPAETLDLIKRISEETNNPTNPIDANSYKRFVARCKEENIPAVSSKTFYRHFRELKDVKKRQGSRQAYAEAPITWYLSLKEKIHGGRPFQCVHIDHTKVDILVRIRGRGGRVYKRRPWLTIAIDAHTRVVLAFYLSVHHPSTTSCVMILREIVRRHRRMPSMLIVDNGREFWSKHFNNVCHLTRTSIRYRPPHESRFGGVCERLFGTSNTLLVHNLVGNTKACQNVRTLTRSVDPIRGDTLSFPVLHGLFDFFFYKEYNETTHPAHDHTPNEYLAKRFAETGARLNKCVDYDMKWRIATCLPVDRGGTRLVSKAGIKVGHLHYWNDAFADAKHINATVEVRLDMWNSAIVYAKVDRHWIRCKSSVLAQVARFTRIELRYLFEAMRMKLGKADKSLPESTILQWLRAYERGEDFCIPASASEEAIAPYEANGTGATVEHRRVQQATTPPKDSKTQTHAVEYSYQSLTEHDVLPQL